MQVRVVTTIWKRPHIVRVFAKGIERLKKDFDIEVTAAVSCEEDMALARELGFDAHQCPNTPLGSKHNFAMQKALLHKWDACLIMNSDGIISTAGLKALIENPYPHVGFNEMIAVSAEKDEAVEFRYHDKRKLIGTGRLIDRWAVELCMHKARIKPKNTREAGLITSKTAADYLSHNGMVSTDEGIWLWEDNKPRGLDFSLEYNMAMCGIPPKAIKTGQIEVMDVKSQHNLWPIDHLTRFAADLSPCANWKAFLSKAEVKEIEALRNEYVEPEPQPVAAVPRAEKMPSRFIRGISTSAPAKKNIVNSHNVEFGYELLSALPYAYHLHKTGELDGTISAVDTAPFYFFSPKHTINPAKRSWDNMRNASEVPNIRIHKPDLSWDSWCPPPLKEQYRNEVFRYEKPILCICNRVNVEWRREVINYFDIPTLEKLFTDLSPHYQIVYFNIEGRKEFYDGVEPVSIGDFDLARKHGAIVIHDLHKEHPEYSYNELQLRVMANCEAFITMNGGYSILASYMGGTNIIYSKECREIGAEVNSFYRWYHKLGGSRIIHVDSYEKLHENVKMVWIDRVPLVNILTRTHERPNFFRDCYNSVMAQTHPNKRVWVVADTPASKKYLIPYNATPVQETRPPKPDRKQGDEYGVYFPFNHYWDQLIHSVKDGWIIALDDDDCFMKDNAIETILSHAKSEDVILLWKVKFGDRTIPSDENFGKNIVVRDVSGIGICFHSKHAKSINIEPFRRADYRLAKQLSETLEVIWIDEVLTGSQDGTWGMGVKTDKQI